jgi:hypothetical protein
MRRLIAAVAFPWWVAYAIEAAEPPQRCAALPTPAERIVCYDRLFPPEHPDTPAPPAQAPPAAAANTPGQPSPAQRASEPSPAAAVPSRAVSAPPDAPVASAGTDASQPWTRGIFDKPQQVHLKTSIKAIYRRDNQPMAFLLANEQIWLQDSDRQLPFRVGDVVTIKNGTFGGYFLTAEGGTKTRVRRIK